MFLALMLSFAVVLAALALVGLGLLTSRVNAHTRAWAYRCDALNKQLMEHSNTSLKAEVDDLRGALDVNRASNRRELGAIWGRLGGKPSTPHETHALRDLFPAPAANDDRFEAMIALQSAPHQRPSDEQ